MCARIRRLCLGEIGHLLKVEKEISFGNEGLYDIFFLSLLFFIGLFSN